MTTPQPNEAPVEVCQEAKDAAEQLYRWMADECKDHEGKEFLPACVCCDYAGMRHFINAMAKRLNPACLAYAQRKVENRPTDAMTSPQPNEAPVEVCQEAKDAAKTINNLRSERTWDDIWNPIHRACLAYAQRKVEEATAELEKKCERFKTSRDFHCRAADELAVERSRAEQKRDELHDQLTAAQAEIARLREALDDVLHSYNALAPDLSQLFTGWHCDTAWSEWDQRVFNDVLALQEKTEALAATDPNHERKP